MFPHYFKIIYFFFIYLIRQNKDEPSLLGLLSADFRRTGKCNAAFAKKPFGLVYLSWGVSKNYSQFENYQRG